MGLFSFLFANPEKLEKKGDLCFDGGDFGTAKMRYEEALACIEKKEPADKAFQQKITDKLCKCLESLASKHMKTAEQLLSSGIIGEATDLIKLALELTKDPDLASQLKAMLPKTEIIKQKVTYTETEEIEESRVDVLEEAGGDVSDLDEFMLITGTLPDHVASAYQSYGDLFRKGFLSLNRGDFESAAELLERSLEQQESSETYIALELATALIHLDKDNEAETHLRQFLTGHPGSYRGVTLICDLYCEAGKFDEAHAILAETPVEFHGSLPGVLNLGRILFLEKKYDLTEELYREYLSKNEWHEEIARGYSMALEAMGEISKSKEALADLINNCTRCHRQSNSMDRKRFADLSLQSGDHSEKTLNIYLKLAQEEPEIAAECYRKAAIISKHQGHEEEAYRFETLAEQI